MPSFPVILRFVCLAFAVSLAGAARADNWERFHGPNGSGISKDTNVPIKFGVNENVRWKIKIDGTGHASPIVWGDRVFLQAASSDAAQRSLLCLDAKTGKEIWKRSVPAGKPNQKLRFDTSLASASATTDGEAVFVPFWNGKEIIMAAYDFKGERLWERNFGEFVSQHGAGASPILYKDLLIFSLDMDAFRDTEKKTGPVANAAILYALNKKTGKIVWQEPREAIRACYSMPFLVEKPGKTPELIVTSSSAITSYNPETGKSNWYWTWSFPKMPLRTIAATAYCDGLFLACSGDGSGDRFTVGVALKGKGDEVRPEQVWSSTKEFPYVTCPLVKGEHVFFANDLGRAGCFVAKTGKKLWLETVAGKFYASPVMIGDNIYAPSESGDVFVFAADPKEYRELARNSLRETIRATPAVANGAIFIRTEKHLYCFGK